MYDSTYDVNVIFTCYSNLLYKIHLIIFFANRNFMGSHWQTTQSTWHLRALFWAGQVDFWVSCFASGSMTCTPSLSTSDALPQEDATQSKLQVIHTSAILTILEYSRLRTYDANIIPHAFHWKPIRALHQYRIEVRENILEAFFDCTPAPWLLHFLDLGYSVV